MALENLLQKFPDFLLASRTYYTVITDLEGNFLYTNPLFNERFQFLDTDFLGKSFIQTIYHEDLPTCLAAVEACMADPGAIKEVILRKPETHDGHFFTSHWNFALATDAHEIPFGIVCIGHDVTDSVLAAKNALEETRKTDIMLRQISDGIVIVNTNWKVLRYNPTWASYLPNEPTDIQGQGFWPLLPENWIPILWEPCHQALQTSETLEVEWHEKKTDTWLTCTGYPTDIGLTLVFKDHTRAKKAEIALHHSREMLRAILDSSSDSHVLIDKDYHVLLMNNAAVCMANELFGKDMRPGAFFPDFILKEYHQEFYGYFAQALRGLKVEVKVQREFPAANKKHWFLVRYFPVFNAQNQVIWVAINTIRIDEEKAIEERLISSELKLKSVLDSTSESYILVSPDFKVMLFNKQIAMLIAQRYGKTLQEGDDFQQYVIPETYTDFRLSFQQCLKGKTTHAEMELRFPDGTVGWRLISFYPAFNREGAIIGVSLNIKDIQERKAAEQRILSQNQKLREIAWAQSHLIRRPVSSILGLLQLIETQNMTLDNQLLLENLHHCAEDLDNIIHEIVRKSEDLSD
jgi:PAS domain S-box-containing protein